MQLNKKRILFLSSRVLLALFVTGAIGAGISYSKREALLKDALERLVRKAKRNYHLDVVIGSARFSGPTSVAFSNISIVPENRDSLVRLERAEVGISIWPLLIGKISIASLTLQNGLLHIVRHDSTSNIDVFLHRKTQHTTQTQQEPAARANLAHVADKLMDNLLSKIPDAMNVRNIEVRVTDQDQQFNFLTERAVIDDEQLTSTIQVNNRESTWHLAGTVAPSDREANVALYADGKPLELPYLERRYKLKMQIDTVRAELRSASRSGDEFTMEGIGAVHNLRLNHPAITRKDILVDRAAMDINIFVGENYIGIDSTSTLFLGKAKAHPFIKYTIYPTKIYEAQLHTDPMKAQDMFDAFPRGLFESLEGIKVAGQLKYDFDLYLDSSLPDSVKFEAGMTPYNFRILKFGQVDFTKLNEPFDYIPYEKGKPVRTIRIGPENPNYIPLGSISRNLRNSVLTAEDYSFFNHKGFNEKAFRVSIATDFKTKMFKRGASTISMQLVKNAFLNRNKTLSRKIEEILIVWLIENQRLISKERMLEVYLNIIEWGRNIYGIGEASRYYFGKHPSDLDIGESILLAYVVPSPKSAMSRFYPDGSVKTYLRGYFKLIGRIMARRGLTSYDTTAYGFYNVRLREGLRQAITPDSSSADTTLLPNGDVEPIDGTGIGSWFRRLFEREKEASPTVSAEQPSNGNETSPADTVKIRRQLQQERKRREKEERNEQNNINN